MAYRIKEGDLVYKKYPKPEEDPKNPITFLVVKGPYMAIFTDSKNNFSQECLAVDIIYDGEIFTKIKCDLLQKLKL